MNDLIKKLEDESTEQLAHLYRELLNEPPSSINQLFLSRNISHKLQENDVGGFPIKLRTEINQLIKELDPVNLPMLRSNRIVENKEHARDKRLPIPGTVITKKYKDQLIEVKVLESGFEYKGQHYRTLTKIAEKITGSHWSGFNFFNLE